MQARSVFPHGVVVSVLVVSGTYLAACQSTEPRTDAERLVRGREIIQRMSDQLGSTPAFTVTTTEAHDEVRRVAQIHDLHHIAFAPNTATLVRITQTSWSATLSATPLKYVISLDVPFMEPSGI